MKKRRETLPDASLEDMEEIISKANNAPLLQMYNDKKIKISKDSIRLAEVLGFINSFSQSPKLYKRSEIGEVFLSNYKRRKEILYISLISEDEILPDFFNKLIKNKNIRNSTISTNQLCEILQIDDLWSGEILNKWARYLGISLGRSNTEVHISQKELKKLFFGSFVYLVEKYYNECKGKESGLAPFSKIRSRIKNSGILNIEDSFDDLFEKIILKENKDKISFSTASQMFGKGFRDMSSKGLIKINFPLMLPVEIED